jgi:hypothetical protein
MMISIACLLLTVAALPLLVVAESDLPPRPELPTETPTPTPTEEPAATGTDGLGLPEGAAIVLHAVFDPAWPWYQMHGRDLWTVVEWQHPGGEWYPVKQWQGTLDTITVGEDDVIAGRKTWWVYETHLGKGPFRWSVYAHQNGALVARSDTFDLPEKIDQKVIVDLPLKP